MQAISTTQNLPESINIAAKVAKLNFGRLKNKYTSGHEAKMTSYEWDIAELEYRRFLSLKMLYPMQRLVPSKQVNHIWHAHILDTRAYREDCEKVFGRFIDHYPYFGINGAEDQKLLQKAFDKTIELYEMHFGNYPNQKANGAARCGEYHACHVPSSCACRVSGACK